MQLSELQSYKPQILAKAKEYGLENIRVALPKKGNNGHALDAITLIVGFKPGIGWGFFSFAEDVEQMLHCDVDVLTDQTANSEMYKPFIADIVPL